MKASDFYKCGRLTLLLTLFCFFFPIRESISQNIEIKPIPVNNNGYSSTLKKKLFIDGDGFLWYSTFNGVVKYMGSESLFYPLKLGDNRDVFFVHDIVKSTAGNLWVATSEGVYFQNLTSGNSFWLIKTDSNTEKDIAFVSLKEGQHGDMWVGTNTNLIYHYSEGLKKRYSIDKKNDSKINGRSEKIIIEEILEDGSLILKRGSKWMVFANGESTLVDYKEAESGLNGKETLLSYNGAFFDRDSTGYYYYEGEPYCYMYLPEINRQIIEVPLKGQSLLYRHEDGHPSNGDVDLVTSEMNFVKTYVFRNVLGKIHLKEEKEITFNNKITNFTISPGGYLWVHTDGIYKVHYKDAKFTKFLYKESITGGESDENPEIPISCRGLMETGQGELYIFTNDGFYKQEGREDDFVKIDFENEALNGTPLPVDLLYNFYKESDDVLWAYGFFSSLYKLNLKTQTFVEIAIPENLLVPNPTVFDIEETIESNKLLLGGNFGLIEFDINTSRFRNAAKLNDRFDITGKHIFEIHIDRDKKYLWLGMGTHLGLYRKNLHTDEVDHFDTDTESLSLIDNTIRCFYEDDKKNIWIGTEKGLQRINPKTLQTVAYREQDQLKNGNITGILESGDYLWFGTFDGLVRLNKKSDTIQGFYVENGIPHNEFNTRSVFESSDHHFYFGGLNGLVRFDPNDFFGNNRQNKLYLTSYKMFSKRDGEDILNLYGLGDISTFKIPYNNNHLALSFAINDIFNTEKNVYQYRIKETDNDWISLGNYNTVQLRGLSPDNYTLEVRGFSSTGQTTNTLAYTIHVEEVFYKKIWFIFSFTIAILAGMLFWLHRKKEHLKVQIEHKTRITYLEAKTFRALMNPHFIFNAVNSLQSVLFLKSEFEANKFFGAFSNLVRLTMEMGDMDTISLKEEINYLKAYIDFEKLKLRGDLTVFFDVSSELDIGKIRIPSMLFQPIVENAILHGLAPKKENRELRVSFVKKDQKLIVTVIDNGIGRAASERMKKSRRRNHKSRATLIMNERISMYNIINGKKISVTTHDLKEGKDPLGTKVVLSIPLKLKRNFIDRK
ncbi:histidine kinase [Galbibacter sp. EGI 63066]|uniref:sensor histidine kinase n=1 Tax=Galbibacter sp. EGI 63066 TaxID=2993559 RepID=UPI0022489E3D|nr:two-component regulator propeller domain-containing protein [Galbibacter sp. EGI 63066]MCX2681978.1 histidine kinase [Galbibacter sp. EGI 63066]